MRTSPDTRHPDARIAELAARQHGVVSRTQLAELGIAPAMVTRRLATGRLLRVAHGVYAVGVLPPSAEARAMAAVLASGPGAVLSHASAAAVHGLRRSASRRIHVTVPFASGRRTTARLQVHRARRPVESTTVDGIPVTTVARTLADLAETERSRVLERACEQAHGLRLLDMREIDALVAAHPRRPGPLRLRALLAAHDLDQTTRSGLEDAFLELCDDHGLPRPLVNARVGGFEVDFHWPAARVIAETDTYRFHGGPEAFAGDRARDRRLAALGWHVVRATGDEIRNRPAAVAGDLRAVLSGRSPSPSTRGSPSP
jgi:hypothetical protein